MNEIQADATTVGDEVVSIPESGADTQGSQPGPGKPREVREVRGNRVLNWFFVRDELVQARENASRFAMEQREYVQRSKVAFELGELALRPGNAVRSGATAPLAANLFRQSVYWALLAQHPEHAGSTPESLWAAADADSLSLLASSEVERAQFAAAMRSTFVELAEGSPVAQRATAKQLRGAANRLLTRVLRVPWQLEWAKLKRVVRVAMLVAACVVPLLLAIVLWPVKPDLAKGKPWHASSVGIECHPERSDCGGVTTDILFHTKLENDPWFEYDFGAPLAFSSLTIKNRSDFGPERAVPLVVEVSNDDKKFQQIASRTESFATWKPSFPTQQARYLRLRVRRESMLHLEAIQVHP